jgi:hypothetical protein
VIVILSMIVVKGIAGTYSMVAINYNACDCEGIGAYDDEGVNKWAASEEIVKQERCGRAGMGSGRSKVLAQQHTGHNTAAIITFALRAN